MTGSPVPPYFVKQASSPESLAVYTTGSVLRACKVFYIGQNALAMSFELAEPRSLLRKWLSKICMADLGWALNHENWTPVDYLDWNGL